MQVDNTSAVSYINRLGGSKSKELCEIALQITHWCEIRNLSLTAVFIPGRSNIVEETTYVGRLEAGFSDIQHNPDDMEAGGGSFCQLLERTIAQICQPFSATRSVENGCVLLPVEESEGILLPPFQHDPVLPIEHSAGIGGSNFNSSILAKSTLVPGPYGNDGGDTQASLPQGGTAYIPNGGPASADEELINQTNRMEALRSSLESRGLPKNVIELLLGAARLNTQAAYQSAWNAWNSWCIKRGVHSMSATVNDVLSFLAEYFSEGKSYSSAILGNLNDQALCIRFLSSHGPKTQQSARCKVSTPTSPKQRL
ncbi:hypothetical protein OUZ56_024440 [Daphnia magna]|uniref:Uncharacterized protein n=1 Tax=Daphnia magna TaxID=35525 RepID=A0ABR0B0Z7_9CRUS|nr:hypothetical protein OUZ56_024440 [Daphnia magna]